MAMSMLALTRSRVLSMRLPTRFLSASAAALAAKPVTHAVKRKVAMRNTNKSDHSHKDTSKSVKDFTKFVAYHLSFRKTTPSTSYSPLSLTTPLNTVTSFPAFDRLVAAGVFSKNQHHELMGSPVLVVRPETLELSSHLSAFSSSSLAENVVVIHGEAGTGKSTVLAQTLALAAETPMVLLHVNNPAILTDGLNDYVYNDASQKYSQPLFTRKWLKKVGLANKELLVQIPLLKQYLVGTTTLSTTNTLYEYLVAARAHLDTKNNTLLQGFFHELEQQTRFPVVLSIDNFNDLCVGSVTQYRLPEYEPLHISSFDVASTLVGYCTGASTFARGGVVLATNGGRTNNTVAVITSNAVPKVYGSTQQYDEYLAQIASSSKPVQVEVLGMSPEAVGALVAEYVDLGIITEHQANGRSKEEVARDLYFVSGNGNPRLLVNLWRLGY